jgi:hypothetical protein
MSDSPSFQAVSRVDEVQPVVAQWLDVCSKQTESPRTHERTHVTNTVEAVFARMGLRR